MYLFKKYWKNFHVALLMYIETAGEDLMSGICFKNNLKIYFKNYFIFSYLQNKIDGVK